MKTIGYNQTTIVTTYDLPQIYLHQCEIDILNRMFKDKINIFAKYSHKDCEDVKMCSLSFGCFTYQYKLSNHFFRQLDIAKDKTKMMIRNSKQYV